MSRSIYAFEGNGLESYPANKTLRARWLEINAPYPREKNGKPNWDAMSNEEVDWYIEEIALPLASVQPDAEMRAVKRKLEEQFAEQVFKAEDARTDAIERLKQEQQKMEKAIDEAFSSAMSQARSENEEARAIAAREIASKYGTPVLDAFEDEED